MYFFPPFAVPAYQHEALASCASGRSSGASRDIPSHEATPTRRCDTMPRLVLRGAEDQPRAAVEHPHKPSLMRAFVGGVGSGDEKEQRAERKERMLPPAAESVSHLCRYHRVEINAVGRGAPTCPPPFFPCLSLLPIERAASWPAAAG